MGDDAWVFGRLADAYREEAQNALDAFCEEIRSEYPKTDNVLRCGVPAEEIVSAAEEFSVDLIVISTHNYGLFTRRMRGATNMLLQTAMLPAIALHQRLTFNQSAPAQPFAPSARLMRPQAELAEWLNAAVSTDQDDKSPKTCSASALITCDFCELAARSSRN